MPVRVLYINGIKNLRVFLDTQRPLVTEKLGSATAARAAIAIAPGVLMTPFSSILEASNAGHLNPEPLSKRWTRGLAPRMLREVIFAIGLNQSADACEQMLPRDLITEKPARSIVGSVIAGIGAGYLSHVPHNLSSLKLLQPSVSYREHFNNLVSTSITTRFSADPATTLNSNPMLRKIVGSALVFLLPRGVVIRTMQIVGSFIIVNGTIAVSQKYGVDRAVEDYGRRFIAPSAATVRWSMNVQ
jgi:hypothetical protein